MRPDKQMFFNFDKCKVWCPRSHGDDDRDADDNDDQARNQDFMWGGGAKEAKVDQTTEMYFLLSHPFI